MRKEDAAGRGWGRARAMRPGGDGHAKMIPDSEWERGCAAASALTSAGLLAMALWEVVASWL